MTYREFNKRIFELYLSRSSSTFAIFSFDTLELESVMPLSEIKRLELLRTDWGYLLREVDNLPQYFGLLAIQCCAASLMETSDDVTLNAYQLRLVRLLGLKDETELQQLFKQEVSGRPVQEVLWNRAKKYLRENLNQNLVIPEATANAGRYVQYPKFQALFNTEELKHFTQFFSETFQVKENIAYIFFESRFRSALKNISLSPRMRDLLADPRKAVLCTKQLYDYYNRWDGELYELKKKKENLPFKVSRVKGQSRLFLILGEDEYRFYLSPGNVPVPFSECLSLTNYHYFYKTIQVFSEIPGYINEYEHTRFLYKDTPCCLLIDKSLSTPLFSYLKNSINASCLSDTGGMALYTYRPSEATLTSPLQSYIQSAQPVSLTDGLRLKQKDYLAGFGPVIQSQSPYVVLYQNAPCNYQPQSATPGRYDIRTDDFKDLSFEIIQPGSVLTPVLSKNTGWNLGLLAIGPEPTMEGCLISDADVLKVSPVRTWISLNLSKGRNRSLQQVNSLFMAINNAKT